jgi:hypothetical protein
MMRYVVDSSALWRLLRDPDVRAGWTGVISDHAIGSCQPQRTEFRRSARNLDEYEQMTRCSLIYIRTYQYRRRHGSGSSRHSTDCCGLGRIERCPA